MQEKSIKEITVKELVEEVDINRSTFYLHYTDIFNMLSTIEEELLEEIRQTIQNHPVSPFNESSFPFIEDIFHILAENKDICSALLGPNGDIALSIALKICFPPTVLTYCARNFSGHY